MGAAMKPGSRSALARWQATAPARGRATIWAGAVLGVLALLAPAAVRAVPEADHLRVECVVLRLAVNDYTVRRQVKLMCTLASADESRLAEVEGAQLTITSPSGQGVTLAPQQVEILPRVFKAANAKLLFKAIDDSAEPSLNNVPQGFLGAPGQYRLKLSIRDETVEGEVGFGEGVSLRAEQGGKPVKHFTLSAEQPLDILSDPAEFGPVYFKRQDLTNFLFQMANMDQALSGGDFRTPVESPLYIFQVRIGDLSGGPTKLLDPARYIDGYQPHLIRSERTSTPLHFDANDFVPGQVVIVDFLRQDTVPDAEGLHGPQRNFSSRTVVINQMVVALAVEQAPTAAELGEVAASSGER